MSALRKLVSIVYWLLDSEKSINDFRKNVPWIEGDKLVEEQSEKIMSPLVITAHVFYTEFLTQLIDALGQLPQETKVLATTPSKDIKRDLELYLQASGNPHIVRLTPNTGRNFGPLFVEFSKLLSKEESFIHVHSKKSLHSPEISQDWLMRNLDLFLSKEGIQRITQISESNPAVGLVSSNASDLIRGVNFRWGRSLKAAKEIVQRSYGFENLKWRGKLSFPAGGMFWVRTDAIKPLLELDWTYENFPAESFQRDGQTQHAIERLIGEVSISRGFQHVVYDSQQNKFHHPKLHKKHTRPT
jgi:lipopolysaccharide biosynthesis protein